MKAFAAGIMVMLVSLFTGSCGGLGSSTSPLPPYTPTAGDLHKAYSEAIVELNAAQEDLQVARDRIVTHVNAVPDTTLDAIQEARDCDIHIDDLTNDPRGSLNSVHSNLSDPLLTTARDAPREVAHGLAAAHVASPANRDAIEAARDAHIRNQLLDRPMSDDPVFEAYLAYLDRGDNFAFVSYLTALDEINDAYFPVDERLNAAKRDLVLALVELPGNSSPSECAQTLFGLYETYMRVFEVYRPALLAYLDGIKNAIDKYAFSLEAARSSYVP